MTITDKTKERIILLINTFEDKKLSTKSTEFEDLMREKVTMYWFSNYFVYIRVPKEPAIHNHFRKLIYRSNIKDLNKIVYKTTISMINRVIDYVSNRESL